jgi:glutaredoxin
MSAKELIMYSRSYACPFVATARYVLDRQGIPYQEIHIDRDESARTRVLKWTGFESVPTLVVANLGQIIPAEEPLPLRQGSSPRGIDRGYMLTEPSEHQLTAWLDKHGLLQAMTTE